MRNASDERQPLNEELAEQLQAQVDVFRSKVVAPVGAWRKVLAQSTEQRSLPAAAVPLHLNDFDKSASRESIEQQRNSVLRMRRQERVAELRALPVQGMQPSQEVLGAMAELKTLEGLPLQKRLRTSLLQEVRKSLVVAAAAEPGLYRRPLVSEADEVEEQAEAMMKQQQFLGAVLNNARTFQTQRAERLSRRRALAQKLEREFEKAAKKREADEIQAERDRIQKLREGDEEGYLALLQEKKNDRLEMLLQQTADFMNKISAMVAVEKNRAQKEQAARAKRQEEIRLKREAGVRMRAEKKAREKAIKEGLIKEGEEPENQPVAAEKQEAEEVAEEQEAAEQQQVPPQEAGAGDADLVEPAEEAAAAVGKPGYSSARQDYYLKAHAVQESVTQPEMLRFGTLREYQLEGLKWMVSLYNNNLNGILADEMGLGKTIQTIALVAYLVEKKNNPGPYLVIVPLSTISNWVDEFARWTPDLDVVVYQGSPAKRQELWSQKLSGKKFHVLLTTFDFVMRDKQKLGRLRWNFIVIDEGHRLKNAQSKLAVILSTAYKPRHRLILTGTPLQNNLPELWSLLNFILPNIFHSVDSFEKWFNAPFETTGEKVEMTEEESLLIIRRLHSVLRPFLLRRLKSEVESQLPEKSEKVIRCPMSLWQQKIYDRLLSDRAILTQAGARGLQNRLMQLRKVCNHPYLFDETTGYDIDVKLIRVAGKFALLDSILPKMKATGHRILIFSQMTSLMDILGYFFSLRGYTFLRLDGGTKQDERREAMQKWNAEGSEFFIFMLSTRAGGLGLNLQTADTVILFDSDWNPQADLQAMDRAHRIGQKKEVLVLRLITAHSIEERILATATRKLDMDNKVIGAGGFNQKAETKDRRSMLEALFQQKEEEVEGLEVHTRKEVNERLARSEEEYQLFKRFDKEHDEKMAALGAAATPPLVTEDELPEWLTRPEEILPVDPENASFKDLTGGIHHDSFGRGKRRKTAVVYSEQLDDDEFCELVERGLDEDEIREYIRLRDEKKEQGGDAATSGVDALLELEAAAEEEKGDVKRLGTRLIETIRGLKDGGRYVATPWLIIWGPEGPPVSGGRPANKPLDLTDVENRLHRGRYSAIEELTQDLERVFEHVRSATPQAASDVELATATMRRVLAEASAEAAAVNVAAERAAAEALQAFEQQQQQQQQAAPAEEPALKKLKIKLTLPPPQ